MYTESQTRRILDEIGVRIVQETGTNFLGLCPFHANNDSPAFSVEKTKGVFMCWNGACGKSGNIEQLVRWTTKKNEFEVQRLILRAGLGKGSSVSSIVSGLLAPETPKVEFVEFSQDTLDRLKENFWQHEQGRKYMHERGFDDITLEEFDIGYSVKKNMITVPMHTDKGMPVGFIGRTASHTDKRFKNSTNLPTSKTMFNIHRAKGTAEDAIMVEASFDAMRIRQAGFPNVVGTLGGYFNDARARLMEKYFTGIILMLDDDKPKKYPNCRMCRESCVGHKPGEVLGFKIADMLPGMRIRWAYASTGSHQYYGFKDPTSTVDGQVGMTNQQIKDCISNAITHIEYKSRQHSLSMV